MLATAYREQAELETTLTLTKSNLQLAIANNEMLEDALRNRGTSKDVGWRRSRPPGDPILEQAAGTGSPSLAAATPPSQPVSPNPPQQKDSRFLSRFRFGSSSSGSGSANGTASPKQTSPVSPLPPAHSQSIDDSYVQQSQPPALTNGNGNGANHLTSASLPSLPLDPTSPLPPSNAVSPNPNQAAHARARLESAPSLRAELARERAARSALEAEIEALSAALFEEANKMVATERRARAEMQEELHTVKTQRDALKQALRVVESENGVLRGGEWTPTSGHSRPSSVAGSPTSVRSRRSTAATAPGDLDETPRRVDERHKPPPLRPPPEQASNSFSSDSNYDEDDEFEDAQDGNERREDGYAILTSGSATREDDMRTPRVDGAFLKSSPAPVPPGGFVSD
ncbi:hypothetical protein EXIGLDRAFT_293426 [Exidia glandulosa HHB12029]|uniref:GDP/GTP exchange factor Sec2 N-terminal domain-containing protein n=1 Tax=Exidia glandulosa HHB12029 TaxID=1314781 RepID=A0A165M2M7_EXIGL|nr:hypothetical protein EXIGLDRAFT_293426 [Exidia glandulosa HHB12029]